MTGDALVVVYSGRAIAVCWNGTDDFRSSASDWGVSGDTFDFEDCSIDHAPLEDGVYIGKLRFVDDGPGDWPGSREAIIQFHDERPATKAEWVSYAQNEYPWVEAEVVS